MSISREEFEKITATVDLDKRWLNLKKCIVDIDKIIIDLSKEGSIFGLQGVPQSCLYLSSAKTQIQNVYNSEEEISGPYLHL